MLLKPYIRRNILQQNPSEIAAMDKEIEAEKALGIKPEPRPDLIRALGGAKAYGMGYDQSPNDVTKDVDSGLDTIGSEKDPSMSADPNDPNAPQETEPSATNGEPVVAGAGGATAVQDTALNGSQVESLLTIVTNVKMGLLPKEAGKALVDAAFPSLTPEQINSIFDPIKVDDGPPPVVPQAPNIPGAKPAAPKAPKKPKV
jgi:hypothetical protein